MTFGCHCVADVEKGPGYRVLQLRENGSIRSVVKRPYMPPLIAKFDDLLHGPRLVMRPVANFSGTTTRQSLTQQQLAHFRTFGFIVLRGLLSDEEMLSLSDEFERKLNSMYAHMPWDDSMRHWSGSCLGDDTPMLQALTEDHRFAGAAKQMYGDDVLLAGVDGNRYTSGFAKKAGDDRDAGFTRWHSDHGTNVEEDCYGVKMAIYLDPTAAETGALRLVPGSHLEPLHSLLREMGVGQHQEDLLPSYVCSSLPGDVVMFDMRCFHAAFNGSSNRRMCTVVYYNNPQGMAQEEATRARRGRPEASHRTARQYQHELDRYSSDFIGAVPRTWVQNPNNSQQRAFWIRRKGELGYLGDDWKAQLARL